jgi:predicted nucleic acid-binding protein
LIAVATAGAIYSLYDSSDAHHIDFVRLFQRADISIVVPAFVLPEVDHLIRTQLGAIAQGDFLDGLTRGFFIVEPTAAGDWQAAARLIRENSGQGLGLTDATVVSVAQRLTTLVVLTANEQRFRRLRTSERLTLLPADS